MQSRLEEARNAAIVTFEFPSGQQQAFTVDELRSATLDIVMGIYIAANRGLAALLAQTQGSGDAQALGRLAKLIADVVRPCLSGC